MITLLNPSLQVMNYNLKFLKALAKLSGSDYKGYNLVYEGSEMYEILYNIAGLLPKVPDEFKSEEIYAKLTLCFITFPKKRLYDATELKWMLSGFSLKVTSEGLWFRSSLNDVAKYNEEFLVKFDELNILNRWLYI